jgi:hypothetical protein
MLLRLGKYFAHLLKLIVFQVFSRLKCLKAKSGCSDSRYRGRLWGAAALLYSNVWWTGYLEHPLALVLAVFFHVLILY